MTQAMNIHVDSLEEGQNIAGLRRDLFGPGRASLEQNKNGNWIIVGPDEIISQLRKLDKGDARARLLEYAAQKRAIAEAGNVRVGNRMLPSDFESVTKIAILKTAFDNGTISGEVDLKTAGDNFFIAGRKQVDAIYTATLQRWQSIAHAARTASDAINAGNAKTTSDVDRLFVFQDGNQ